MPPQTQKPVRGGYEEIETIHDPGGATAIISERVGKGTFTVAYFRTYERDGVEEKTSFFGLEHMDSLKRMIETSRKRIETLKAAAGAKSRSKVG